ncbi:MAG: 3-hydroxy-5-phosphonooxypentane-2,4-dione thiolase [bacterium]
MADLDDIRDGKEYGIGIEQKNEKYFLKGSANLNWGMKDRLSRIFNPKTGHSVMLAFDHGFLMGPTSGLERIDLTITPLMKYADCLMCTRGVLSSLVPTTLRKPVCLRSDAGTTILTEMNHNVVMEVKNAVALNASAMAVMVGVGDKTCEAETVANLYRTIDAAQPYGMPVMGVTAVGKDMARDARYFGLAARVCSENGANIVKTYYTEGFEKVVACCSVPIVIAGGKKLPELEALELAYMAIQSGAAGVDMGRNVFQSDDPAAIIQAIGAVVHKGMKPAEAFQMFNDLKKN